MKETLHIIVYASLLVSPPFLRSFENLKLLVASRCRGPRRVTNSRLEAGFPFQGAHINACVTGNVARCYPQATGDPEMGTAGHVPRWEALKQHQRGGSRSPMLQANIAPHMTTQA